MDHALPLNFDPERALRDATYLSRVQPTDDQHHLDIRNKERTSALPWRGQFSPQLIEYLLGKNCSAGDRVIDPFCGSGTVLREAAQHRISAIGLDVNPAAVCLARIAEAAKLSTASRWDIALALRGIGSNLQRIAHDSNGEVSVDSAISCFEKVDLESCQKFLAEGYLLTIFGDNRLTKESKIGAASDRFIKSLMDLPRFDGQIRASYSDARFTGLEKASFDYMLTSPPYINVFNYHQNYRPIAEALGYKPLSAARTEIGANRKFRQNRYLTVVQYCMDISMFFVEAQRILKPGAKITIILGRESSVRSVAFRNGELIFALACEGLGYKLNDWHERKFLNRFGEIIYEDVITLSPTEPDHADAVEIGRSVGRQALRNALDYCPPERRGEIEQAVELAADIPTSPKLEVHQK